MCKRNVQGHTVIKRLIRDQTQLCFFETPSPNHRAAPHPRELRCGSLGDRPVPAWGGRWPTVGTRGECLGTRRALSSLLPFPEREVRHKKSEWRGGAPSPALLSTTLCSAVYKCANFICNHPNSFTIGKAAGRGVLLFGCNIRAS